jgi:hypothetical protein
MKTEQWRELRSLRGSIALICIGLCTSTVFALPVNVSWTHPTANTDGSPLPISGITSTRIEYGSCVAGAFGVTAGEVTVNAPASSAVIDRPAGTHCFRAATRNTAGNESAFSNVAQKIVSATTPNAPGITFRTIAGPVFAVQITRDSLVLPQQGTVAAGVTCDPSQVVSFRGQTLMLVPVASVTLLPELAAEAAWAVCQ